MFTDSHAVNCLNTHALNDHPELWGLTPTKTDKKGVISFVFEITPAFILIRIPSFHPRSCHLLCSLLMI